MIIKYISFVLVGAVFVGIGVYISIWTYSQGLYYFLNIDLNSAPLIGAFGFMVFTTIGIFLACIPSCIFAAKILKIEKPYLEEQIKIESNIFLIGPFVLKYLKWCLKIAYKTYA